VGDFQDERAIVATERQALCLEKPHSWKRLDGADAEGNGLILCGLKKLVEGFFVGFWKCSDTQTAYIQLLKDAGHARHVILVWVAEQNLVESMNAHSSEGLENGIWPRSCVNEDALSLHFYKGGVSLSYGEISDAHPAVWLLLEAESQHRDAEAGAPVFREEECAEEPGCAQRSHSWMKDRSLHQREPAQEQV